MRFEGKWHVGPKTEDSWAKFTIYRGTRRYPSGALHEVRVDEEGWEVVNPDGGDMGRASWKHKPTLKRLGDGRWLVVLEGTSGAVVHDLIRQAPAGGELYRPGMVSFAAAYAGVTESGIWPIYGASGGLAHAWVAYLIYEEKPEEA